MLTEKDYCDRETCIALDKLGCPVPKYATINIHTKEKEWKMWISLYDAQKWLREKKNIIVCPEKNSFGWFYATHYNIGKVHRFKYSEEYYNSYEEALSEGIKEAVKILKENETIS